MPFATSRPASVRGFTLIELVMVIVVLGIIGAMVSVFMKSPVDAYLASLRRAALTDLADTAARRMARDIRSALPNSLRTPTDQCLELIPTKTGGRYRSEVDASGLGERLDFTASSTGLDMLGGNLALPADQRIPPGDVVAIYNLGIADADAYRQDNTATVVAVSETLGLPGETRIGISGKVFPLASGSSRFQVIPAGEKVVAYVCHAGNLHRTASADFSSNCPATGPVLARQVSACSFDYSGPDLQRDALVRMVLQLTDHQETVSLFHEVHVNNTP
ncbi:MAG: type II secretion system protein [Polaromonas sp.]|nr:type II secretion system protein [Polaromonas sp.]